MTARQPFLVAIILVNIEFGDTVHALELTHAFKRHLRSTSHELQEFGLFFTRERSDGPRNRLISWLDQRQEIKNSPPKPLDLLTTRTVVVVLGVGLPVIDVDVGKTRNQ